MLVSLGKICQLRVKENRKKKGKTLIENERSPPLFAGAKAGSSKMNSDDVLASPTKNTRKRKSTIPTVDSPAMATRVK
jgi:hypothetical protein